MDNISNLEELGLRQMIDSNTASLIHTGCRVYNTHPGSVIMALVEHCILLCCKELGPASEAMIKDTVQLHYHGTKSLSDERIEAAIKESIEHMELLNAEPGGRA